MSLLRLCGPSWWCETCALWWDGSWSLGFNDPHDGTPPALPPDLESERALTERTCAECGGRLVPRARLRRLVQIRDVPG